jgi:type VI protein secretion system component Hcp
MSEQIPQDPERQEGGGVEGAMDDLEARDEDAEQVSGGRGHAEIVITKKVDKSTPG